MEIDEVSVREKSLAKLCGVLCLAGAILVSEDFNTAFKIAAVPLLAVIGVHFRVTMIVPEGYKASFMTRMEPEFIQKWLYLLIFWGVLLFHLFTIGFLVFEWTSEPAVASD